MRVKKIDALGPPHRIVSNIKRAQFLLLSILLLIYWGSTAVAADQNPENIRVTRIKEIRHQFNQPTEVAVGPKGNIFVLDGANHRVKIFTPDLTFKGAFGRAGEKNGEFRLPVGMDIDHLGQIYIADTGNQRIQIFNADGGYLRQIDLSSWKARAVEVQVGGDDRRIYVADARNHQILCFDQDGAFNFSWGALGQQPGELRFPGMMAATQQGDLHVVDILNGRVQIFDPQGQNPRQISELGILPGQLYRPKGIAVDERAQIFVSDSYTGIIQVFDQTTGKVAGILSTQDGSFLRLTTPLGMALDNRGRLFVVQSRLNQVSVFQLDGGAK